MPDEQPQDIYTPHRSQRCFRVCSIYNQICPVSRAYSTCCRRALLSISASSAISARSCPRLHATLSCCFPGVVVMGYQLSQFAETVEGLTGQQRVVFAAMCKVTDDRHGFFWMDSDRFRAEHLPHIKSNSTLRNHISALIRAGYVRKVHQGAGPRNGRGQRRQGRAAFTQYFIDAPGITPDLPRQYRMPTLVLMTPAEDLPALFQNWDRSRSDDGLTTQSTSPVRKQDKSRSANGQDTQDTKLVRKQDKKSQDLSEKRTSLANGQSTRPVRYPDETRQYSSENQTGLGVHVSEGNQRENIQGMHAGMVNKWTEMFIGLCARRSGLTGLRPQHLQERPRSRNGPIPSVFDSVSAYIERVGCAPSDDIAGWIADEIHYTLVYDPGWQDGGHNSSARLVSFISAVVARHLEREELGGLFFDPAKGAPETSGHRYQPAESSAVQPIRRSL